MWFEIKTFHHSNTIYINYDFSTSNMIDLGLFNGEQKQYLACVLQKSMHDWSLESTTPFVDRPNKHEFESSKKLGWFRIILWDC